MKKTIISMVVLGMLAAACTKTPEGNAGVIKETPGATANQNEATNTEQTERYVAEDGSSAHVTFRETAEGRTISIRSNNKTISAPLKEEKADGDVYGSHDMEIRAGQDSVIITQGDNVIMLKKARGQ